MKEDGDFTNTEAEQAIAKYIEFKAKDLDLIKKYVAEFRKFLPATKIAKLVTAGTVQVVLSVAVIVPTAVTLLATLQVL